MKTIENYYKKIILGKLRLKLPSVYHQTKSHSIHFLKLVPHFFSNTPHHGTPDSKK